MKCIRWTVRLSWAKRLLIAVDVDGLRKGLGLAKQTVPADDSSNAAKNNPLLTRLAYLANFPFLGE